MRAKLLLGIGLAAIVAVSWLNQPRVTAQAQDIKAVYDRAATLGNRTSGLVYNEIAATPTFIDGGKLWYRKTVKGGNEFVLVDPVAKTKAPAFDHARLATAINTVANRKDTAVTLPFSTFTYIDSTTIQFAIAPGGGGGGRAGGGGGGGGAPAAGGGGAQYRCMLTTYVCTQQAAPQGAAGPGQGRQGGGRQGGGGGGRAGGAPGAAPEEQVRNQPNGGCWQAMINNFNIYLRPYTGAGAPAGCQGQKLQPFMLSTDGSEGNAYRFQSLQWSPDGRKIAALRRRPGYDRQVHYIESRPADQLQPKHTSIFYRKPGDVVDFDYPVVFDVASKRMMQGDISLFPNPYAITALDWWNDSRAVTFEYNQRGHEIYRVLELDATTGKTRTLIEEAPKTFVEYSSGKRYRRDINDGREIIWQSERDGWNHLYLIDGTTGTVKNQITKGQWIVRNVVRVDEKNRQIWFNASGMHAGKDPYFLHHYRVNFDGTGLTAFTSEDGTHQWFNAVTPQQPPQTEQQLQQQQQQQRAQGPPPLPRGTNFSLDGQYYVDRWERVDLPPIVALKRSSDQSVVMELERADDSALQASGWKRPEVFVSKARDGVTDIWGIIIRPTNFDPARKYPVIENIYAGPQGSFVPKTWSMQGGMMGLAELGFIVVQVDGLGTSNRSKAFHDVAWKNLGDAGFPDRIIWHKAIAAKYPWYDISRVGIYGTSAGGQNATGGMLFHPDFYKVAVSNSGCHDNRMDKIWWNEQWMGWPLGPHYAASSNVDNAKNLKGKMQLVVPEMDSNVDPTSTLQVVAELVRAGKEFELVFIPGANHGAGSLITQRKRNDFFVKHLLGIDPPDWNNVPPAAANGDDLLDEPDYFELERAPFFPEGR
jgi:dipeptidyl aminopeptidase/acylaminoacyl peptidase